MEDEHVSLTGSRLSPEHGPGPVSPNRSNGLISPGQSLDDPLSQVPASVAPWEASRPPSAGVALPWSAPPVSANVKPTGAVRSHTAKHKLDPDGEKRPPRPPNAWILYRSDCIQKQREARPPGAPKPTQAELSKLFGEQWRNESDEVKSTYERQAEAAREEHAQKYPDWRFARRPIKLPVLNTGQPASTSPHVKPIRLQPHADNQQAKKRRRDTSAASSDPSTPYGVASDYASSGASNVALPEHPSQRGQSSRALTAEEQHNKRHHNAPSVFPSGQSQYSFPSNGNAAGPSPYGQSVDPNFYKHFSQQEGLNSTLAQRNTSAAQFYGIQELSPRSSAANLNGRPATSHAENGTSGSFRQAYEFSGPSSAPTEGNNLGFYINDNALPFDHPHLSLPTMPFGMTAHDNGFTPSQPGDPSTRWSPSLHTAPPLPPGMSIDPSLQQSIGLDCPEWLYALRHVRVRQDDYGGIPLLDFLGDAHARSVRRPSGPHDQPPSNPSYSFP